MFIAAILATFFLITLTVSMILVHITPKADTNSIMVWGVIYGIGITILLVYYNVI